MKMNWNKGFFRSPEDEGAGGASGYAEEGAQPAPDNSTTDKFSALEERLAQITQSVDGLTQQQKRERAAGAISARESELTRAKQDAESAVGAAERTLAEAYDNGEGVEIAKAQRALTEAIAKRERADMTLGNFKEQLKAAERKQESGAGAVDDTNLRDWKSKHSAWYGVDAEMTKASHEIDRQIRAAGVLSVGSKDYFNAIDRAMSQKYPDRFGGTPPTGGAARGGNQGGSSSRGVINRSIAEGYRRMGINIDDPKVAERMVKNREVAVQKGILPSTPVGGQVVTR